MPLLEARLGHPEGSKKGGERECVDGEDERETSEEEEAADVDRVAEEPVRAAVDESSAWRGGRGNGESELPMVTPAQIPRARPAAATIQPTRVTPSPTNSAATISTKRTTWATTQPVPRF